MPLVKVFARRALRCVAADLHQPLCRIWKVPTDVLKVLVFPAVDQSVVPGEDVYVDLRAKAKPDRTKEVVQQAIKQTSNLFYEFGHSANIRVELYDPSLQSAFYKAPHEKMREDLELADMSDAQLDRLFRDMDTNNTGLIDAHKLKVALDKHGLRLSDESIKAVISAADEKGDGVISPYEFMQMSRGTCVPTDAEHRIGGKRVIGRN